MIIQILSMKYFSTYNLLLSYIGIRLKNRVVQNRKAKTRRKTKNI